MRLCIIRTCDRRAHAAQHVPMRDGRTASRSGEAEKRSFFIPQSPRGRATLWMDSLALQLRSRKHPCPALQVAKG
eukprot:2708246-Prymnesium_polylepis.1